jgi:hypothetical protein
VIEERKLQALVAPQPRAGETGFTLFVLRDPHPPQNVPVAFSRLDMNEWSPQKAEEFMAEEWGWAPAPGATWEALPKGCHRIRPLIAKEQAK